MYWFKTNVSGKKHAIQAHGAFCTTWQMSSKLTYNGSLQDKTNKQKIIKHIPLAKLEGKWKFKDIHSDTFLCRCHGGWRIYITIAQIGR